MMIVFLEREKTIEFVCADLFICVRGGIAICLL